MYTPVIIKKFSGEVAGVPKQSISSLRKKIRSGNIGIMREMKKRGSLEKLQGHKDITLGKRWNRAKKIGIGVGAVVGASTLSAGYLAAKTAGKIEQAGFKAANGVGNQLRKAIPDKPREIGLAQQANPASTPQQVTNMR